MKLIWNENLGREECPYMKRWALISRFGSIRLHQWFSGDDKRFFHDHPWWFITLVLKGEYKDISPNGEEILKALSIKFRPAYHRHTVETNGALTLLITGPEIRIWGFWTKKKNGKFKFMRAREYFFKHGHHPCDS